MTCSTSLGQADCQKEGRGAGKTQPGKLSSCCPWDLTLVRGQQEESWAYSIEHSHQTTIAGLPASLSPPCLKPGDFGQSGTCLSLGVTRKGWICRGNWGSMRRAQASCYKYLNNGKVMWLTCLGFRKNMVSHHSGGRSGLSY